MVFIPTPLTPEQARAEFNKYSKWLEDARTGHGFAFDFGLYDEIEGHLLNAEMALDEPEEAERIGFCVEDALAEVGGLAESSGRYCAMCGGYSCEIDITYRCVDCAGKKPDFTFVESIN